MTLPDTTPDPELPAPDRAIAGIPLPDGGLVLYDPQRAEAWLRCEGPTPLER
jgi:hypothetical protein